MARDLIAADDTRLTDMVVTEVCDDPPFHKQVVGTVKVNGDDRHFAGTYNVNVGPDERLKLALDAFHQTAERRAYGA
jgi:hypothetical protein